MYNSLSTKLFIIKNFLILFVITFVIWFIIHIFYNVIKFTFTRTIMFIFIFYTIFTDFIICIIIITLIYKFTSTRMFFFLDSSSIHFLHVQKIVSPFSKMIGPQLHSSCSQVFSKPIESFFFFNHFIYTIIQIYKLNTFCKSSPPPIPISETTTV